MDVAKVSYNVGPAPDNPKDGPVTEAQSKTQEFYADTLGWDFEDTWEWNDEFERPTLQAVPEE